MNWQSKSFDELVDIYDNAVREAEERLPAVIDFQFPKCVIAVRLDHVITKQLKDADIIKNTTLDPYFLTIEFEKVVERGVEIGWRKVD